MKTFGGSVAFLNRNDINTDEIIPAKYLTEISKEALKSHLLEDLVLEGFDPQSKQMEQAKVLVTRSNFGCGSSREHAVWVLEVNDINVVIAESFARIFRQNCFNCGILAIELEKEVIDRIFYHMNCLEDGIRIDLKRSRVIMSALIPPEFFLHVSIEEAKKMGSSRHLFEFSFELNEFDRSLIETGGWLAYADQNY